MMHQLLKNIRGSVRVVRRWSAKPFTGVRFPPTSPTISQIYLTMQSIQCNNIFNYQREQVDGKVKHRTIFKNYDSSQK